MIRTRVGIVGAGPAGLLLAHLLHRAGIATVLVEAQSRAYIEARIRAGVLEHGTVATLTDAGVGERLAREGLAHRGINLAFGDRLARIDVAALSGGRAITVYGQHEAVKDLVAARLAVGGDIRFEARDVAVHDLASGKPRLTFSDAHGVHEIACDYIAGCDGFHGICRPAIPPGVLTAFERVYPFAWLGILAHAAPALDELVYANHTNGFALLSMRSPTVTRLYLQCAVDEDITGWSDRRIWDELHLRLEASGRFRVVEGDILQKGVTGMRSFVVEPMQYGRLFLAGDAAHIVPPTGAKGMNLAVADVRVLARGLVAALQRGDDRPLARYSATCLARVWKAQRFSWWLTSLMHKFPGASPFENRVQLAELDYLTGSRAAMAALAENYAGLPYEDDAYAVENSA